MAHEIFEKLEFACPQLNALTAARDLSRDDVQLEIRKPETKHVWPSPSKQYAYPSQQFGECERLDQVVVCPLIQPRNTVVNRVSGGQHENGHLRSGGSQRLQNF